MSAFDHVRSIVLNGAKRSGHLASILLLVALAACATAPTDPEEHADFVQRNDPAEPTNRAIFDANIALDDHALRPVAEAYRDNVPKPVQAGLRHAASNLGEPEVAFNHLLQGRTSKSWNSVERFAINSTLGLGGLFDVATDWGVKHEDADFGQTFGVWGVGEGPFVELPLFGPSNPRDALGTVLTLVLNPFDLAVGPPIAFDVAFGATDALDQRAQAIEPLDDLRKNSIDFYAALRSAYRQNRTHFIETAAGRSSAAQVASRSPASEMDWQ